MTANTGNEDPGVGIKQRRQYEFMAMLPKKYKTYVA